MIAPFQTEAFQVTPDITGSGVTSLSDALLSEVSSTGLFIPGGVFMVLIENRLSPGGGKFSYRLLGYVEDNFTKIALDPIFAFNVESSAQPLQSIPCPVARVSNLSEILVLPVGASFKLTKQSLQDLRDAGLSHEILGDLKFLEEQVFTEENTFLDAVEERIGKQQAAFYKKLLLKHALPGKSASRVRLVKTVEDIHFAMPLDLSLDLVP